MKSKKIQEIKQNISSLLSNISDNIDSLYEIATKDEKTKIYNYKFFSELFSIEFEKAKRGQKLSLAIFDIDYFKKINSKYGHIKADDFLVKIAKIIQNSIRKSDILARFGGEEFILLLPLTSKTKAKKTAERIRRQIEKNFKKYNITISGGISQYKKKDTKSNFKKRADKALYKAKKVRNKMVCL